jgi:hypothetical protein
MGVSGQHHAPAALYPRGKDPRYPLYRRLGVVSRAVLDAEAREKSAFVGDRTPVVRSVVRHCTDWATPAPLQGEVFVKLGKKRRFVLGRYSARFLTGSLSCLIFPSVPGQYRGCALLPDAVQVSGDFMSLLQNLIPGVILSQKYHVNMHGPNFAVGPIFKKLEVHTTCVKSDKITSVLCTRNTPVCYTTNCTYTVLFGMLLNRPHGTPRSTREYNI